MGFSISFALALGCSGGMPLVAPALPVAPTAGYVSALVTGASGTTRLVDYNDATLRKDDVLIAVCFSRQSGTITTTPPAGEGWALFWSCRLSGFTLDLYWKRWGAGDTDPSRQTSTFTFSTGSSGTSAMLFQVKGCRTTGNPYSQLSTVPGALKTATASPISDLVASAVGAATLSLRLCATIDDNTLITPSRGSLVFGGASYNMAVGASQGSLGMISEADVDSSTVTATLSESTNGNDTYAFPTIVLEGQVPPTDPLTVYTFSTSAVTKTRVNGTGWRTGVVSDRIVRSGYHYRYAACINLDKSLTMICQRKLAADTAWTLFATHTTAVIPDPTGSSGTIANWPSDSHFSITLGVSKTGIPEMWLLAHGTESEIQHWRGTAIGDVLCDTFAGATPITGVAYPQAFQMSDGTLMFSARIGSAGNDAQQCLYEQKQDETGWTQITAALMNFTDGTGDDESPYMDQLIVDPARDRLHIAWTWAKSNTSHDQHSKLYFYGERTGVNTWVWKTMNGSAVTLPVLDTTAAAVVESAGVTLPMQVHGGLGFDPATGYPLIPYAIAHGTSAGSGTDFYLATWNGSAFVKNLVGVAHATYNLVGAPPASERNVIRTPDCFMKGGTIYFVWTGDLDLSTSAVSCLMCRTSTDGGATWSTATRLADLPFGGDVARYDRTGLTTFGRVTYYQQLLDDDDGVFLLPTNSNASIVDVAV